MVAQQGVGKRVGDGLDVLDVQAEKVGIVALGRAASATWQVFRSSRITYRNPSIG